MVHGSVMASKPKTMQDAIEFATELMDKKINTLAECQVENKRKLDNNNQAQQQPPKKQGVAIAYTDGSGERKEYARTLPGGVTKQEIVGSQGLGHYKRNCLIVKFHKRVDKYWKGKARGDSSATISNINI
ncbi:hypothetical protein Tco_0442087 [Tanacetum coccineum]